MRNTKTGLVTTENPRYAVVYMYVQCALLSIRCIYYTTI